MARIVGVEIPNDKRVVISLTYIHGIGKSLAKEILEATKIDPNKKTGDLTDEEIKRLYNYIDKNIPTEGQVKQKVFQNIKRLKEINCYRGRRHKAGLPVRGQRTRANCRTRKGKAIAVGGLRKALVKK